MKLWKCYCPQTRPRGARAEVASLHALRGDRALGYDLLQPVLIPQGVLVAATLQEIQGREPTLGPSIKDGSSEELASTDSL